jgi:hypothetical protein
MAAKEFIKPVAKISPPESVEYFPPNTSQGVMANYKRARHNSTEYRVAQIAKKYPEIKEFLKSK